MWFFQHLPALEGSRGGGRPSGYVVETERGSRGSGLRPRRLERFLSACGDGSPHELETFPDAAEG
jgi:hypothetical protein